MINKIKSVSLLAGIAFFSSAAFGVGSFPGEILYTQPDGTTLNVTIHGDDRCHWYTDSSGALLMPLEDGSLIPASSNFRSRLYEKREAALKVASASAYTKFPTLGSQKVLIILVEYQDKKFAYSADDFRDMLCKPGYSEFGAAGSAYDYFVENSTGRFIPEFEVFGPVTLSHPMSYYGGDDDAKAHEMVSEACVALDDKVDFSQYDCDGDGWVDNVYVFYAGQGEADGGGANSVWPHSSNLYNKGVRINLDGVAIGSYSCSNELVGGSTRLVGIGTFCHEFSHVLGLPDLYSTNNNSAFTPYYYSLMDHGNYNGGGRCPCALTAYERFFLGWAEPIELTGEGTVRVDPLSSNISYRVSLPGFNEEYYLIENRVKEGWDASLPGEGMLVWHIDYSRDVWDRNAVNNDATRQRVDLIEADGNATMGSSSGDTFPGTTGVTTFDRFTDHTGTLYPFKLSNIHMVNRDVVFDFNGSSDIPVKPNGLTAREVEDEGFILQWPAKEGVDGYIVSISYTENDRVRAVNDYSALRVSDNTLEVKGLDPSTEYTCLVRATKGISVSAPSDLLNVTTAAPGIGYFSPVALEATDITHTGFTANWEEMRDAESYLLDVYTLAEEATEGEVVGFSTPLSLPQGWTTTVSGTMSVSGYFGAAAPSLRFSQNAEMLQTPVFGTPISVVRFWIRGYKADSSASLTLSVLYGDRWTDVMTIDNISNTSGEMKQWNAPDNNKAVAARLTYQGPAGSSVCVDDFGVLFGLSEVRKAILEMHPVGSSLSFAVNDLEPDREYRYCVRGAKGKKISLPSEEIAVRTYSGESAVSKVETSAEGTIRVFTLTGAEVDPSAIATPGVYIIKKNGHTVKVLK